MSFHITHRLGNMEEVPRSAFSALLQEVDAAPDDEEHTSVSVTHDTEWCLAAYRNGYVVFENLEQDTPRHMTNVPSDQIIALWHLLADGDLDALEKESWLPGY